MNEIADPGDPAGLSTWTFERLQAYADSIHGQKLEAVRVVAQSHAYHSNESLDTRRRWAKLSLLANERMHGHSDSNPVRTTQQNFMLRTWIIEQLGADMGTDSDWNPQTLAADTLATLTLDPTDAATLATHWRDLPTEQIDELRRHKNLTAHLEQLVNHLQPGPLHDQLHAWVQARQHLP